MVYKNLIQTKGLLKNQRLVANQLLNSQLLNLSYHMSGKGLSYIMLRAFTLHNGFIFSAKKEQAE